MAAVTHEPKFDSSRMRRGVGNRLCRFSLVAGLLLVMKSVSWAAEDSGPPSAVVPLGHQVVARFGKGQLDVRWQGAAHQIELPGPSGAVLSAIEDGKGLRALSLVFGDVLRGRGESAGRMTRSVAIITLTGLSGKGTYTGAHIAEWALIVNGEPWRYDGKHHACSVELAALDAGGVSGRIVCKDRDGSPVVEDARFYLRP